ncbi:MAG: PQQ-binding-like beta-propeller repeat protein [Candidatus Poribacteria bacterium]
MVWKFRPEPIRRKSRQAFVSALLVADKLYWGVEGHLYVLSKETGKLQWEFYDESAPRLFTHGHERVSEEGQTFLAAAEGTVYIADKQVMFALSAETGQLRWKRFIPNLHSFLQVRPGRVYVSSMDEDFNRLLHALRADTGETDWRIRTEGPEARYVFDEDQIYIKSHAGLRRVSAETGELQWEFLRPAPTPHEIIVGNPLSHSRRLSETKGFLPAGWLAGGYGDRTGV